jgi:hypothetical protein
MEKGFLSQCTGLSEEIKVWRLKYRELEKKLRVEGRGLSEEHR